MLDRIKSFIVREAVVESVKEFFRVVLLAIVPILIMGVEGGVVNWALVQTVGLLAGLRFVDKLLHETGKRTDRNRMTRGLTQF